MHLTSATPHEKLFVADFKKANCLVRLSLHEQDVTVGLQLAVSRNRRWQFLRLYRTNFVSEKSEMNTKEDGCNGGRHKIRKVEVRIKNELKTNKKQKNGRGSSENATKESRKVCLLLLLRSVG